MKFWRFAPPSQGHLDAFAGASDPELVLLSYLVSVLAWVSSMAVLPRIAASDARPVRGLWLTVGALAAGTGVWAMHFTAMVAFRMPVPMGYDVGLTALSAVPAILGGGAALHLIAGATSSWRRIVTAGLCLAAGIGTMHYVGMEAIRADVQFVYDPALFGLSITVAWVLATAALTLHYRSWRDRESRGWWNHVVVAAVAGAAVCGMPLVYLRRFAAGQGMREPCRVQVPRAVVDPRDEPDGIRPTGIATAAG